MATVLERVQGIIAQQLKIADTGRITSEAILADDLNADSLDFVDLTMALEEAFEGEVEGELRLDSDEEWEQVTGKTHGFSVADVVAVLASKGIKDREG